MTLTLAATTLAAATLVPALTLLSRCAACRYRGRGLHGAARGGGQRLTLTLTVTRTRTLTLTLTR